MTGAGRGGENRGRNPVSLRAWFEKKIRRGVTHHQDVKSLGLMTSAWKGKIVDEGRIKGWKIGKG